MWQFFFLLCGGSNQWSFTAIRVTLFTLLFLFSASAVWAGVCVKDPANKQIICKWEYTKRVGSNDVGASHRLYIDGKAALDDTHAITGADSTVWLYFKVFGKRVGANKNIFSTNITYRVACNKRQGLTVKFVGHTYKTPQIFKCGKCFKYAKWNYRKNKQFYKYSANFAIGPVPVNVSASVVGSVGFKSHFQACATPLLNLMYGDFESTPYLLVQGKAFGGVGYDISGWSLKAGLESTLNFLDAKLPNLGRFDVFLNRSAAKVSSDITVKAIKMYLKLITEANSSRFKHPCGMICNRWGCKVKMCPMIFKKSFDLAQWPKGGGVYNYKKNIFKGKWGITY